MKEQQFSIGIDIGGTNTTIGLVRLDGKLVAKQNLNTSQYFDAHKFVDDIVFSVHKIMMENKIKHILGVGIGAPCGNMLEGTIEDAANLKFRGKTPLKQLMETELGIPVVVSNDANAAAYGEMIYGGAKGMKNVVMFTLGTGVGSGIIIDGKLLHGSNGFAGELGHAILIPYGRKCNCGNYGCLEMYASIRGIITTCIELFELWPDDEITQIPREILSPKTIAEAALRGSTIAIETYRKTGEWLGIALANAVTFSDPEAIFLTGGILNAGELLMKPTKESFEKNKLSFYKNNIPILRSQLNENDAAILGAAALVW
ncbi:MAG: ROK family protein [Bacteroidales bacterium]|jgi:glucokinase|nr:ROK family protein [Bacteroidales bacterium]